MNRFHEIHTNWSYCDRRKRISIKEKGKKYSASNLEEKIVVQFHIDDIDNTDNTAKKCDYALYIHDDEDEYKDDDRLILIELKGKDVTRALKQISSTIDNWVESYNLKPRKIDARIVVSGMQNPRYISTDLQRLRKRLIKFDEGSVEIGSNGNFIEEL